MKSPDIKSFDWPPHGVRAVWLRPSASPDDELEVAAALDALIVTVKAHLRGNPWARYQDEVLQHAEAVLAKAMERVNR